MSPDVPAACAALAELATTANAVTLRPGGGIAYALSDMSPMADLRRSSCPEAYWKDHADARVRFTAPMGGRWRFTASGSFLAELEPRPCDERVLCSSDPGYRGEYLSSSSLREMEIPRGVSIDLAIDRCRAGTSCRYTLTAERIADLSCPVGGARVCGEGQRCTIDPCDRERFACVAARASRLTEIRVLADSAGQMYIVGRADDGGAAVWRQ